MKLIMKKWLSHVMVAISVALVLSSCRKTIDYEKMQEEAISNYLLSSDLDFVKQESGLYYAEVLAGEGAQPSINDTVYIHFASYLLNNQLMNSNLLYEPAKYVLGEGVLLPGIEESLRYMRPGGESYALIPSQLGYGNYSSLYDPYTPLLFYLELVDVGYYDGKAK